MSLFQNDVIFGGASSAMPGFPSVMGQTSPSVPYTQYGPNQGLGAVASFMNGGNPGSGPHGWSHYPSNDYIQHTYIAKPWIDDNAHLFIREGMLVFRERDRDAQMRNLSNVVCLPKLNDILEKQYYDYQSIKNMGAEYALPDEDRIELFAQQAATTGAPSLLDGKNLLKSVLRYQTMYGILETWNFIGGILTVPDGTTGEDMYSFDKADKVVALNVVVGKKIELANIWGGYRDQGAPVNTGSRLWLILKRVRKDGPFKFVPFVTKGPIAPRDADRKYTFTKKDRSEGSLLGKLIYVGLITVGPGRDAPKAFREAASGIMENSTTSNWFEAHGKLPMVEVQLGI